MKPHAALAERLAETRRFDQLIALLRDELDWPIGSTDFEDLTFEYDAEELGINKKDAAKIEEIKRLRPLVPDQPWGIFFVKFEPKRLPVVALRRILSAVAVKKRTSANSAERSAWAPDDLLFVSNYGEGEERQINFAHFSPGQDGNDLPTLKVLGWDSRDTALHLDSIANELSEHLVWPADSSNADAWRANWRSAFTLSHREVVTTAKELSNRLAELARNIRDRTKAALDIETDKGPLTQLMKAFQESLVHDLDPVGFADMYAQTIAYGLLSARIADPHKRTADDFAAHMRTNPFLRELMETFFKAGGRHGKSGGPGIDFDELGVSEVTQLLDDANMGAVVHDFGDRNPQEDPVIHFYEDFLKAYDKAVWKGRGVVYTPRPVVSYMVRSVDGLLRTEFGLADGLADTTTWGEMASRHKDLTIPEGVSPDQGFVQVLDPATGTGTFLVEVIDLIHKRLVGEWRAQGHTAIEVDALWNEYVPRHLLTRLHGFELLMAPYAIAHLNIGLKLYETGYRFGSDERARVYLTNALEPAHDFSGRFEFAIPALAHEAQAVSTIKATRRFTVVIGNPPYSNFGRLNRVPFVLSLLDDYKRGLSERKINLDDDFIKFICHSQYVLKQAGVGILGFITNNTYLDGITHRRMRESLCEAFNQVRILDLHGSLMKADVSPDGTADENVFDIKQGVCVSLLCESPNEGSTAVRYHELWGSREEKFLTLSSSALQSEKWLSLPKAPPNFFFVPKSFGAVSEYESWPSISKLFPESVSGIQTGRDSFVSSESPADFAQKIADLKDASLSDVAIGERYDLPEFDGFDLRALRQALRQDKSNGEFVKQWLYRPFDVRPILFHETCIKRMRGPIMKSLLKPNLALISVRQLAKTGFAHAFVTRHMGDGNAISLNTREYNYYFPLHIYRDDHPGMFGHHTTLNLDNKVLDQICKLLGLKTDGPRSLSPDDLFYYAYAVLHSPGYRKRYADFLKIDFPRVPLPGRLDLFRALAQLGSKATALHLLESPSLSKAITEFSGGGNREIEKVTWSKNTVWIDKAQTTGFKGVHEDVWRFHIGGYQVCEKWLKDRKGRRLLKGDIDRYQKIVVALAETICLMTKIDEVIDQHGGWPDAFASLK